MLGKSIPLRDKQMITVAGLQLCEEFLRPLTIKLPLKCQVSAKKKV